MTERTGVAIAAYLRRSITMGRDHERIGPFTASYSRSSRNPFLNYAIPDDGARPTAADVAALAAAYHGRGLDPRLEYLPSLAPAVEAALLAAGFAAEGRLVLMAPGDVRPWTLPDGIELVAPTTDDDLRDLRLVQHEAYEDPDPIDDATVARLRANLAGGAGAVLARSTDDGTPVGAGEYTEPIDGVSEITSIAVRVPWRRRGIATAISSRLLADVTAAGVTAPFLMANTEESRVYAGVGFKPIGEVLHISLTRT
jgi:GNAT superfamily N-acetyltransferase